MKACALALLATFRLFAYDDRQLAVALKAQSDFDRVELVARPGIADAEACVQSQAAALALSLPEERSLLHFRKGYCAFAGAVATKDLRQFQAAVAELDKAIEAWSARLPKSTKHAVPEPASPALRVFAGIARMHAAYEVAGIDSARQEIAAAMESPACKSNLMPPPFCDHVLPPRPQCPALIHLPA